MEKWYRCEVRHYCSFDDDGPSYTQVIWQEYEVVRHTPKGVWLRDFPFGEVFVRGKAKRQLALPTRRLAWEDCVARKKRHIQGCRDRLHQAEKDMTYLEMAEPKN